VNRKKEFEGVEISEKIFVLDFDKRGSDKPSGTVICKSHEVTVNSLFVDSHCAACEQNSCSELSYKTPKSSR